MRLISWTLRSGSEQVLFRVTRVIFVLTVQLELL
jgi:hypothetical protein